MERPHKEDEADLHASREARNVPGDSVYDGYQVITESLRHSLEDLYKPQKERGISTGIKSIDDVIGGFQAPDFYILGARTGVGKSAILTQFLKAAIKGKHKSLMFSIEMTYKQVGQRMIINEGKADASFIRKEPESKSAVEITSQLLNSGGRSLMPYRDYLHLCDKSSICIDELVTICHDLKKSHGLDIVFVDYIQIVRAAKSYPSRHQEIGEVSQKLKDLARDLQIPVVGGAQIRRRNERDANKMPILSELRESGTLEQDSDIVLMLHRDADSEGNMPIEGEATISIPKLRNGCGESVKLYYVGKNFDFKSVDFESWMGQGEISHNNHPSVTEAPYA